MPGPFFEKAHGGHLLRSNEVFLEFLAEKVMTVHEIMSRLWPVCGNSSKKRGDLGDTHGCDAFE